MKLIHCACGSGVSIPGVEEHLLIDAARSLPVPPQSQRPVHQRRNHQAARQHVPAHARVLDPLVLTRERRRAIPIVGDPDEVTLSRVKAFYNALAQMIERETGLLAEMSGGHGALLRQALAHLGHSSV